ncbi:Uncharacterised protein [Mycobacteroides abscessus subsp. massiliense]|jgi:hypothetical protein|uniref:Uncharacterized protein n=2 Tax=Mycobacteroides TaxID=670516 RepID=A0A4R8R942_9MYCO|nr:hypothetical protein CCUG64054_02665 [Mycobacteroides franklinii]CPS02219.1 Uncharacterised protein [Mycobacteroides abscessus]SHQ25556.1 Uncharacterised protein [Mycobacteroides abscessus subsp. abscessus]SKM73033.1 Uncharacterised protein [Mycobacteroides abscessus subsp. massiliense]TDZ52766.1 hypothetical protein CCUG63697_01250 [Mycobacteroides franklinii]
MLAVLTTGKKDATPTTQAARPHDLQRRKDMKTSSGHDALQNRTSPRMFFPERISS